MTAVTQESSRVSTPPSAGTISPSPAPNREMELRERSLIDASTRGPVLLLIATGAAWLMISTLLGFIVSVKLHEPHFLAGVPFLTYGRVFPAYMNSLVYGWCSLTGMGVALWLMARLCRVSIRQPGVLAFGVALWNLGLLAGIGSILAGLGRPFEGMEMPLPAHALMFAGFVMIGLWGAVLYRYRRQSFAFISVWYLLGAFFWFPWVFATANVLISLPQVHGVMKSVVAAWYGQNVMQWWITAIGLAAAYFLIPKVVNRPIYSYNIASLAFWTFAFVAGLTGAVQLSGGPVPVWLVTLSIAASILLIVPVATVTANLVLTMRGQFNMIYYSPTIRFVFFGAIAFAVASAFWVFGSLRGVDRIVHFSQFPLGQQHLLLYCFFSMVMFGAIYYITPRLVGCEWLSSTMITVHFWGAAYGGSVLAASMLLSGLTTGSLMVDPGNTFIQILQVPQIYAWGRTVGWVLVGIGHAIFFLHLLFMLFRIGQPGGEPTLFAPIDEEESH